MSYLIDVQRNTLSYQETLNIKRGIRVGDTSISITVTCFRVPYLCTG